MRLNLAKNILHLFARLAGRAYGLSVSVYSTDKLMKGGLVYSTGRLMKGGQVHSTGGLMESGLVYSTGRLMKGGLSIQQVD